MLKSGNEKLTNTVKIACGIGRGVTVGIGGPITNGFGKNGGGGKEGGGRPLAAAEAIAIW